MMIRLSHIKYSWLFDCVNAGYIKYQKTMFWSNGIPYVWTSSNDPEQNARMHMIIFA